MLFKKDEFQKMLTKFEMLQLARRRFSTSFSSQVNRTPVSSTISSSFKYLNLGVRVVPQQSAFVIERFGKYHKTLTPGLHFLIPLVDSIAYIHTLKEQVILVSNQQAITKDNVTILIDGLLYIKIRNPYDASYGVDDVNYAITQLAQTAMRSELGKITLDKTFEERDNLNKNIVQSINFASSVWGVDCLRYEIRDISPPQSVRNAMDLQAEAERKKRASILESEGTQQAQINLALSEKQSKILKAEAEAESIVLRAKAEAEAISRVSEVILQRGGREAAQLKIAEEYMKSFSNIAKESNVVVLGSDVSDVSHMLGRAMTLFTQLSGTKMKQNVSDNNTSPVEKSPVVDLPKDLFPGVQSIKDISK